MLQAVQRKARELDEDADLPGTGYPFGNEIGEQVKDIKKAWLLTCRRAKIAGISTICGARPDPGCSKCRA